MLDLFFGTYSMVGYTSQNHTAKFNQFIIQFQSDSLDIWHTCNKGVVDVQNAIFTWVSLLFAELWPLEFAKNPQIGQQ